MKFFESEPVAVEAAKTDSYKRSLQKDRLKPLAGRFTSLVNINQGAVTSKSSQVKSSLVMVGATTTVSVVVQEYKYSVSFAFQTPE